MPSPPPLGATWDGEGTNFAIFSRHANRVELCLFADPDDAAESARVELHRTEDVWHAYLPDVRPGQAYGYRVHGPYAPALSCGSGIRSRSGSALRSGYPDRASLHRILPLMALA